MVRFASLALLALSAVASAAPFARRQIAHDEIVPLLTSRGLSDSDILPQLTVRELKSIISRVKRQECDTTADTSDDTAAQTPAASTGAFVELDYKDFQISGGVAGNALAEVDANVLAPLLNRDDASISDAEESALANMRAAAEDAETSLFNPQIAAASGAEADGLQVGKIKNKVLKLRLFQKLLQIRIAKSQAAGDDTSSDQAKLDDEVAKLNKNAATDKASAGETSIAAV
ncbi:hypothetical protein BKA62DRAFT_692123 [Auriculariales sp. MPI-PUGE-AT-0066]|nr:hypothetical protein BKA62DRAFT_692123 [Auriculariales sp. MPI-PUGE-AT-0066]